MNYFFKVFVIGLTLFGIGNNFIYSFNEPYKNYGFNYKRAQIQNNFINVAYKPELIKLSHKFHYFLITDETIQKIKRIDKLSLTGITLEASVFKEEIFHLLDEKEQSLKTVCEKCSFKQSLCTCFGGFGLFVALAIAGVSEQCSNKNEKAKWILSGIGVGVVTSGIAVATSYMIGDEKKLKEHMEEIHKMKKEWKEFFERAN